MGNSKQDTQAVLIKRGDNHGRYDTLLDVAQHLRPKYGSCLSAVLEMCWKSPIYKKAIREMDDLSRVAKP